MTARMSRNDGEPAFAGTRRGSMLPCSAPAAAARDRLISSHELLAPSLSRPSPLLVSTWLAAAVSTCDPSLAIPFSSSPCSSPLPAGGLPLLAVRVSPARVRR